MASARDDLRAVESALSGLLAADTSGGLADGDQRAFVRGRASAILALTRRTDPSEVRRLEGERTAAERRVQALEDELSDDEVQMRVDSALLEVSETMTAISRTLELEHSTRVRLDISKLTVVSETSEGPAPLWRVGSAENWIGAHIATHLGLHRYFVRHERPVPRFLMLDQPTQAYYPSDENDAELPVRDADREAVERMFQLFVTTTAELGGAFQIIVCDHANLPDQWFKDAVVANWRGGERLVPEEWLSNDS